MGLRHTNVRSILLAVAAAGVFATASNARADDFQIAEVSTARGANVADLKPDTLDLSDHTSPGTIASETALTPFDASSADPLEPTKFLSPSPAYTAPNVTSSTAGCARDR